ncbi:hypothetical protein LTR66_017707, partial [Elasticomyces elasticus]
MASFTKCLRPLIRAPTTVRAAATRGSAASRTCQHIRPISSSTPTNANITTEGEPWDLTDMIPTPITHFSETEHMMAESVAKFANDVIRPKAREMDEKEVMDPA